MALGIAYHDGPGLDHVPITVVGGRHTYLQVATPSNSMLSNEFLSFIPVHLHCFQENDLNHSHSTSGALAKCNFQVLCSHLKLWLPYWMAQLYTPGLASLLSL